MIMLMLMLMIVIMLMRMPMPMPMRLLMLMLMLTRTLRILVIILRINMMRMVMVIILMIMMRMVIQVISMIVIIIIITNLIAHISCNRLWCIRSGQLAGHSPPRFGHSWRAYGFKKAPATSPRRLRGFHSERDDVWYANNHSRLVKTLWPFWEEVSRAPRSGTPRVAAAPTSTSVGDGVGGVETLVAHDAEGGALARSARDALDANSGGGERSASAFVETAVSPAAPRPESDSAVVSASPPHVATESAPLDASEATRTAVRPSANEVLDEAGAIASGVDAVASVQPPKGGLSDGDWD